MGRHRTAEEKRELGERARALRAAGRSRREIQVELGIGDDLAKAFLAGTEVPAALRRPRAKDDVREQAVLMRQRGRTYDDIALDLGVSKSSLSLWLRGTSSVTCDALEAGRDTDEPPQGAAARALRTGGALLKEIAEELGISIKAASIYTRGLPWPERARHGGDDVLGLPDLVFAKASIKRHKPLTTRENVGADYHGCVSIYVRNGAELLQRVEGWVVGALLAAGGALPDRPEGGPAATWEYPEIAS